MAAPYTKWNEAEPGMGYDAQAQEWFHNLVGIFVPPTPTGEDKIER
jgi:hypothetical protein